MVNFSQDAALLAALKGHMNYKITQFTVNFNSIAETGSCIVQASFSDSGNGSLAEYAGAGLRAKALKAGSTFSDQVAGLKDWRLTTSPPTLAAFFAGNSTGDIGFVQAKVVIVFSGVGNFS